MEIQRVISYKGAWQQLQEQFQQELSESLEVVPPLLESSKTRGLFRPRGAWQEALQDKGWLPIERMNIGLMKNGLSVKLAMGGLDELNRWIFHYSTLAIRKGYVRIPVLLVTNDQLYEDIKPRYFRPGFSMYEKHLMQLAPLSHHHNFVVLEIGKTTPSSQLNILEIESDPLVEQHKVIDRSIEFPPEYHQAGLGILNFFGTYLREQYPDEEAKVKIIQEGLKVRMVIETLDGRSEVIEKALHDYQLIVTGQKSPENFTDNAKLILGLRSELRIAKVRIEDQHDIMRLQDSQIKEQSLQIKQLYGIIETGLINRTPAIEFNPIISVHNSVQFNQNISLALGTICELKDLLPTGSEAHTALKEIEGSLEAIEKEKDPEKVKKSPAMSKFRRFIDKLSEGNNDVKKAIDTVEQGWDIIKDLAGKYNSIAEWCGLPQVPKVFTKTE